MVRAEEKEIQAPVHVVSAPPALSEAEIHKKVLEIIAENQRRSNLITAKFDPVTGEGSLFMSERVRAHLPARIWICVVSAARNDEDSSHQGDS